MASRAFFLPQQLALDAARVHLNLEPFPDGPGQLLGGPGRICGSLLGNELHNLGGQLVAALRAALVRKRAEQPVLLKCEFLLGSAIGAAGVASGQPGGAGPKRQAAKHSAYSLPSE